MARSPLSTTFSSPEFLEQLRVRAPSAIEQVVRAYTEHLYRAALGMGFDQVNAREIVQNVFATFFESVIKFEGRSHVRTYLFGILYNKVSETRREDQKIDQTDPVEDVLERRFNSHGQWIKPPVSPEQFILATETMGLIEKCLEELPSQQRLAFYLKEVDEESSHDICNILGVTVTNLGVLLYRARNRLRECIEAKSFSRAK